MKPQNAAYMGLALHKLGNDDNVLFLTGASDEIVEQKLLDAFSIHKMDRGFIYRMTELGDFILIRVVECTDAIPQQT